MGIEDMDDAGQGAILSITAGLLCTYSYLSVLPVITNYSDKAAGPVYLGFNQQVHICCIALDDHRASRADVLDPFVIIIDFDDHHSVPGLQELAGQPIAFFPQAADDDMVLQEPQADSFCLLDEDGSEG